MSGSRRLYPRGLYHAYLRWRWEPLTPASPPGRGILQTATVSVGYPEDLTSTRFVQDFGRAQGYRSYRHHVVKQHGRSPDGLEDSLFLLAGMVCPGR